MGGEVVLGDGHAVHKVAAHRLVHAVDLADGLQVLVAEAQGREHLHILGVAVAVVLVRRQAHVAARGGETGKKGHTDGDDQSDG